jgi:DNA-binding YbaB/EbfC family protein
MVNMMKLMQQAASMQKNIQKLQAELNEREYEFSSGGGAVRCVMKGDMSVSAIKIDPKAVDPAEVDMLEDLVTTAVNGAITATREAVQKEMSKITGGMNIPGM